MEIKSVKRNGKKSQEVYFPGHFFLLCCHNYVAVKWGFRSDFQKATPFPYSLPIAFKWWLIIEDK